MVYRITEKREPTTGFIVEGIIKGFFIGILISLAQIALPPKNGWQPWWTLLLSIAAYPLIVTFCEWLKFRKGPRTCTIDLTGLNYDHFMDRLKIGEFAAFVWLKSQKLLPIWAIYPLIECFDGGPRDSRFSVDADPS